MVTVERGVLQVVVPVGFLLPETQEMTVSVNRPDGDPLPVRLRFIPARPVEAVACAADEPVTVSAPTPLRISWPKRGVTEDSYGEPEYGGGD